MKAKFKQKREVIREVKTLNWLYKLVVALIGVSIVFIGVIMLVLPGPGVLVIFAGMAVLASEFPWAQRALTKAKHKLQPLMDKIKTKLIKKK